MQRKWFSDRKYKQAGSFISEDQTITNKELNSQEKPFHKIQSLFFLPELDLSTHRISNAKETKIIWLEKFQLYRIQLKSYNTVQLQRNPKNSFMLTFVLLLLLAYYSVPEREAYFIEVQLQRNPKKQFHVNVCVSCTTSLLLCPRKRSVFYRGKSQILQTLLNN